MTIQARRKKTSFRHAQQKSSEHKVKRGERGKGDVPKTKKPKPVPRKKKMTFPSLMRYLEKEEKRAGVKKKETRLMPIPGESLPKKWVR